MDVLLARRRHAPEKEVDSAFAQAADLLRVRRYRRHMHGDSRIFPVEPVEHCGEQAHDHRIMRADPDFADRRIGQKLDVLHRLSQIVEHGRSAVEQRAAVLCRLSAMAAAIEQPHAHRLLKVRDRS
jgi:hypothetical protein